MAYRINQNKFLRPERIEELNQTLERNYPAHPRDVTLILTLIHTGARVSEVLNIQKKDLHFETQVVAIKGLKGSWDREIPLPPKVFHRIQALANNAQTPEDKVFPIALRTAQGIWHQYRPEKELGLKCLRHTFAVRLYEKTKDLKLVQLALGHKSIGNTMVYADYVYSVDEMRKLLL